MNEEIKKLIESVTPYREMDIVMYSMQKEKWILKSDFDRVVSELTKWNKVEEYMYPPAKEILVKVKGGLVIHAIFNPFDDKVVIVGSGVTINRQAITEWKYIY
jgi:prefoldin subunit 5